MRTLDLEECCEFLKIDRNVGTRLALSGELPGAKIGRAWVFLEDDLVDYLRLQVRKQTRERSTGAELQVSLDKACETNASMYRPPIRPKKAKPTLESMARLDA
jgi:hypothetical protein